MRLDGDQKKRGWKKQSEMVDEEVLLSMVVWPLVEAVVSVAVGKDANLVSSGGFGGARVVVIAEGGGSNSPHLLR